MDDFDTELAAIHAAERAAANRQRYGPAIPNLEAIYADVCIEPGSEVTGALKTVYTDADGRSRTLDERTWLQRWFPWRLRIERR